MKEPGSIPSWGGTVATSAARGELYVCLGSQITLTSEGGWDFDVCPDPSNPCAFSLMYVYSQYTWEAPPHLGRALPGGREFESVPTQMGTFPIVWKSREGKLGPTPPPFSGMPEPCDSVGGEEVSVTLTVHVVEACRTWEAGGAERKRRLAQTTWTKAKGGRGGCDPPPSWPDGPAVIWPPVDDPNECDISTVNCEGVLKYRTNGELIGECCFLNGRNSFYVKPLKLLCEPRRRTGEVVHIVQTSGTCDSLGRYKFRIGRKDLTTGWKAEYSVYRPVLVTPADRHEFGLRLQFAVPGLSVERAPVRVRLFAHVGAAYSVDEAVRRFVAAGAGADPAAFGLAEFASLGPGSLPSEWTDYTSAAKFGDEGILIPGGAEEMSLVVLAENLGDIELGIDWFWCRKLNCSDEIPAGWDPYQVVYDTGATP